MIKQIVYAIMMLVLVVFKIVKVRYFDNFMIS